MTDEITSFIRRAFPSVWALDGWTAEALIRRLHGSPILVDLALQSLLAAGIAEATDDGRYRYAPASPATDRLAEAAAELYRARPDAVRRAIVAEPGGRFQALADAFKLRKD